MIVCKTKELDEARKLAEPEEAILDEEAGLVYIGERVVRGAPASFIEQAKSFPDCVTLAARRKR